MCSFQKKKKDCRGPCQAKPIPQPSSFEKKNKNGWEITEADVEKNSLNALIAGEVYSISLPKYASLFLERFICVFCCPSLCSSQVNLFGGFLSLFRLPQPPKKSLHFHMNS